MKHDDVYLRHMLEAADDILTYAAQGKKWFLGSRMGQQAIVRNFEIIGEAAAKLAPKQRPNTPKCHGAKSKILGIISFMNILMLI